MLLCSLALLVPVRGAALCVGDSNDDGKVTVSELIAGVNVALGNAPIATAGSFDVDRNGVISVNELVLAVGNALGDCDDPIPPDAGVIRGASRLATADAGAMVVMDFFAVGGGRTASAGAAATAGGAGPGACDVGTFPCGDDGGTRTVTCEAMADESVLTETFASCRAGDPTTGGAMVRNGTRTRRVPDPAYCSTCAPADVDTVQLTEFSVDVDCDADCVRGLQRARLSADALAVTRRRLADGIETVLRGDLTVENLRTGERYVQRFPDPGFVVTQRSTAEGFAEVMFSGAVSVDGCLGPLHFETQEPVTFAGGAKCPRGGVLDISLTTGLADAPLEFGAPRASSTASADAATAALAAADDAGGYRDRAFRSLNGYVYQVLQNVGGDPEVGADDFRVTTIAGSATELFPCQAQPVAAGRPQVTAALGIAPLALDRVRVSERIADASPPCFNPAARGGDGLVCIGPGCNRESCTCASGAQCALFTRGTGELLGNGSAGVPPARLVGAAAAVDDPRCPQDGYATYVFGDGAPATSLLECTADPTDSGVLLPNGASAFAAGVPGSTIVLAYDVPFGSRFVTGSGALSIDRRGTSACGAPDTVTLPIHTTQDVSLPPRVAFNPDGVQFNYNADAVVDQSVPSCDSEALLQCRGIAPPTPTPNPQCNAVEFGGSRFDLGETRSGTTEVNHAGGASCGGGGNDAPDVAYLFKAPQTGFYVFDSSGSDFDTVLYLREASCDGPELACNDDRDVATSASQLGVELRAAQRVIVVLDGFAGEGGNYALTIRRVGAQAPTPTPAPTVGPIGPTAPDLVVSALSAHGNAAGAIEVSATLTNHGAASPAVAVEFVFSADASIDLDDVRTGVGCNFAGLSPQASAVCAGPLAIPDGLPAGSYFVGAIADADGRIAESDESNNTAAAGPLAIGTAQPTGTPTASPSPSRTPSATATPPTPTVSPTASVTVTAPTATATATPSHSAPPTLTATGTRSRTPTRTGTVTPTGTPSPTPTGPLNLVFARPVGVAVADAPSAGLVALPALSQQDVWVTILSAPAAGGAAVTVTSSAPAIATVPGAISIAAGAHAVTLPITTGGTGTAVLQIRVGGEVRTLTVLVGQDDASDAPAVLAPVVGVSVSGGGAGVELVAPTPAVAAVPSDGETQR